MVKIQGSLAVHLSYVILLDGTVIILICIILLKYEDRNDNSVKGVKSLI